MPNTASARKAMRASGRNKTRNTKRKNAYKKALKTYRVTIKTGTEEASKLMPKLFKTLDKAAKAGTIKKNTARRLKSRAAHAMTRASKASS
jgi:small subunit ribosomal protein S20